MNNTNKVIAAFIAVRNFLAGLPEWASRLPSILLILTGVTVAATAVVLSVTVGTSTHLGNCVKVIDVDSAPAVALADHIRITMFDMDADVCNAFLIGAADPHAAMINDKAQLVDYLVSAAQSITSNDRERAPIASLVSGLSTYEGLVRAACASNQDRQAGIPAILRASDFIQEELAPSAEQLGDFHVKTLEDNYVAEFQDRSYFELTTLPRLALLVWLVLVQVFLTLKFRRLVNLPLALATLILAGITWLNYERLQDIREDVRIAVREGFDSVHALSRAKTVMNGANTDETLFLLATDKSAQTTNFVKKISHVINADLTDPKVFNECQLALENHGQVPYIGYLPDELNNINFPGEAKMALTLTDWLRQYLVADAQLRVLENSGQHAAAVSIGIGEKPGDANYLMDQANAALEEVLQLNQDYYEKYLKDARDELSTMQSQNVSTLVVVLILAVIGIRLRLGEYN